MTDVEDYYPLTPLQQGMLFHTLSDPQRGMYLQQLVCEFREPLDEDAFLEAWRRLTARHSALRTSFSWKDQETPVQTVHRSVDLPWSSQDWRGLPAAEQELELETFLQADRQRALDLASLPPFRLSFFQLAHDHAILVWTSHHALLDGRSRAILLDELFQIYDALRSGAPLDLPPPVPFRRFADWLRSQDFGKSASFWRRLLASEDEPYGLDLEAPSGESAPEEKKRIRLCASLSAGLRDLANRHDLSLNTLLQGAWAILLSRYAGRRRVTFGVTRAGRRSGPAETAQTVGLLMNTLPLPVDVDPGARLLPWLGQLRALWASLEPYEHTPLIEIRKYIDLGPSAPLFESIVSFESYHLNGRFGGRCFFRLLGRSNYPIAVYGHDDDAILLEIEYDSRRISPIQAERMLGHLESVLSGFASNPQSTLAHIPLLTELERRQILEEWNTTERDYPRDACVHRLFEAQARRTPDRLAVVFRESAVSYGALNDRAGRLARYLRTVGAGPGARIGICATASIEMIVGMLAILKIGAAYVPLDPSCPGERLSFMLRDSGMSVVLTHSSLSEKFQKEELMVVCLDQEQPSSESAEDIGAGVTADSIAYIIYTSGSTGEPKGVCVPHRAITRLVVNSDYVQWRPSDVVPQLADPCFDAATFEIWGALLNGTRLVVMERGSMIAPQSFAAEIARYGITTLFVTTALFNELVRANPGVFRGVRNVLFGGEECDGHAVKAVLENDAPERLLHMYGPTEATTFAACYRVPPDQDCSGRIPIGRPIANTTIYILDENLNPQPAGVKGEICIGGDGVAAGYLNQPQLTAAAFVSDPFHSAAGQRLYRTGDLGRYLPDGNIEFLGRRDQQVKIRGFRVEVGEIEARLSRHPEVWQSVVEVRNGTASSDKRLVAFFVPAHTRSAPTAETLRRFLGQSLPRYMIPARFVMLDRMPLTARGKVDRRALVDPGLPSGASGRPYAPPWNPVQELIVPVWEQLLGVHPIGIQDDFFQLGGNSLLLVRAGARMEQALGWEVPLSAFFPESTIESIALKLVDRAETKETPVWKVQSGDAKPPLFFLHGDYYGLGRYCLRLAQAMGPKQPFYAIHPHGVAGQAPPTTIEAMAAEHLESIRAIQPSGPYFLAGFCNGAVEAYAMARLLQARGEVVGRLIMIDPPSLRHMREFDFLTNPPEEESDLRRTNLLAQCSAAIGVYQPNFYAGRVIVLQPEEKLERARAALKEWGDFTPELEPRVVPGGHLTILTSHIQALADELRSPSRS